MIRPDHINARGAKGTARGPGLSNGRGYNESATAGQRLMIAAGFRNGSPDQLGFSTDAAGLAGSLLSIEKFTESKLSYPTLRTWHESWKKYVTSHARTSTSGNSDSVLATLRELFNWQAARQASTQHACRDGVVAALIQTSCAAHQRCDFTPAVGEDENRSKKNELFCLIHIFR